MAMFPSKLRFPLYFLLFIDTYYNWSILFITTIKKSLQSPKKTSRNVCSELYLAYFISGWNILKAMSQKLKLSSFLNIVSSEDLDCHNGHQMSKDKIFRICPIIVRIQKNRWRKQHEVCNIKKSSFILIF